MKTIRFSLHREHEIKCKLFLPQEVRHIILGVHGFAGDKESSMLNALAVACADDAAAVLCFDFPAHGESPVQERFLTVENCKKDLLTVAAYVQRTYPDAKKSIFATSFGGYITLLCAQDLTEFQMLLRAPAVTMPEILLKNVLNISAEAFAQQGFVSCGFERPLNLPYGFYEDLLCQEDLLRKEYRQPLYIFHGDRDDIVPLSTIEAFAKMHKNINLTIIKGADHRFKNAGETESIVLAAQRLLGLFENRKEDPNMKEIRYKYNNSGLYVTADDTIFDTEYQMKIVVEPHDFSIAIGGEVLRSSTCGGCSAIVSCEGEVEFYDREDNLLAKVEKGDRTYAQMRLVWKQDLITVEFGRVETVDYYPNCDGEYDRYGKQWVTARSVTLNETNHCVEVK